VTARLLPLLVCLACAAETVERPAPPPVDWPSLQARHDVPDAGAPSATAHERAVAQGWCDAVGASGFSGLGALLDEQVHFTFAGAHDALGRDKVVREHEARLGMLDERHVALTRVLLAESSQVFEWTLSAVHAASHKSVSLRGVTVVWTRDDGAITDLHLYFDEALLLAQLGQGPKGLSAPSPSTSAAPAAPQRLEHAGVEQEERGVSVVRACLDALENNDEAAYLGAMTDDVEWLTPETPEPLKGKAVPRGYFKTMRKAVAQLDTQIDHAWAAGPFVAVEYRITGEQKAALGWVPLQKSALLDLHLVDIAELRDGKIARIVRYENPLQLLSSSSGGAR
jgi:ketosteroid isomerase-like protein